MDGPAKNDQQSSIFTLIQSPFQSIEDAVQGFTQLEQIFYDRRDRRAIFVTELQPIQDLLAQKYCQSFKFLEVIGGQLEQMVENFAYTRAQNGAWENALSLSVAQSEEQRGVMIQEMDRRTTVLAQDLLLRGLPASAWIIQVLRHIESAYSGPWSEWVSA
ncbi:MAG: DUF5995 family protein [Ktedonobacteraceae bacterium]